MGQSADPANGEAGAGSLHDRRLREKVARSMLLNLYLLDYAYGKLALPNAHIMVTIAGVARRCGWWAVLHRHDPSRQNLQPTNMLEPQFCTS